MPNGHLAVRVQRRSVLSDAAESGAHGWQGACWPARSPPQESPLRARIDRGCLRGAPRGCLARLLRIPLPSRWRHLPNAIRAAPSPILESWWTAVARVVQHRIRPGCVPMWLTSGRTFGGKGSPRCHNAGCARPTASGTANPAHPPPDLSRPARPACAVEPQALRLYSLPGLAPRRCRADGLLASTHARRHWRAAAWLPDERVDVGHHRFLHYGCGRCDAEALCQNWPCGAVNARDWHQLGTNSDVHHQPQDEVGV